MDWKKLKQKALTSVDTAIGIAERLPEEDIKNPLNTDFSYENSVNPFPFLIDLIRRFKGYDYVVKLIARFIACVLPIVEMTVKEVLIANLKNLLYCTIDPRLNKNDILRDGITIKISDIDLLHTLNYCPINSNSVLGATTRHHGHLYYFGCSGFKYPSELVNAGDFNAFLWYVSNRTNKRVVWYGTDPWLNLAENEERFGRAATDSLESYLFQKKPETPRPTNTEPDKKEHGILTLIRYPEGETPRNALGYPLEKPLTYVSGELLHVYIGNTANTEPESGEFIAYEQAYQQSCTDLNNLKKQIAANKKQKSNIEKQIRNRKKEEDLQKQQAEIERINDDIERDTKQEQLIDSKVKMMSEKYMELKSKQVEPYGSSSYRALETNYYYNKTLMEFNYDYVMSIKLFDSKVVAAQLIDNLLNLASSGNISVSYERRVIEEEVKKMLQSVLERGDITISDCFFAFSNEELNNLQRKVELQRAGLYSSNGEDNSATQIDVESLLNNLNGIADNATQEEVQTVIENTLMEVKKEVCGGTERRVESNFNAGIQWNFVKNLMENLLTVIVETLCSPKVYLVYIINLKMLGQFDLKFNLEKFLQSKGELVAAIAKEITNIFADFLLGVFNELKSDIVRLVKDKIIGEQYEYYKRLIQQCIECFQLHKDYLDFRVDDVDYADILQEEPTNQENNC